MSIFHFLNVKNGDCSIIQHNSANVSVIDINNASSKLSRDESLELLLGFFSQKSTYGNFQQKNKPVNPIKYLRDINVKSVFRFILTHADMDHMDGLKDFFEEFNPTNFWDTNNKEEKDFDNYTQYNKDDWLFYKSLRDKNCTDTKRLTLYSDSFGQFYNRNESNQSGGDCLYILSPTSDLITEANKTGNYNDASYVILYRSYGGNILFCGDAQEKTWEHILSNHENDIKDVDIMIAPHHGRKPASRDYTFLDVIKPKITFFGNAPSENLAYDAWDYRNLPFITNNQANCIIVNTDFKPMKIFVTNEGYARKVNPFTYYDNHLRGYYLQDVPIPIPTYGSRRLGQSLR